MSSENAIAIQEDLVMREVEQRRYIGAPLVRQGTVAVVLRNGRVAEIIGPGRRLMLRLPFQKVEILLVDTKIRNLNIVSQGEFLTADQWRVNISLWISYRVSNPARVAVEYAEPVHALYSTVKDLLGQVINNQDFQTLSQTGRQVIRREILRAASQVKQMLGITVTDARVDDLTLPERVGSAFDERRVAQMEGEAEQWHIRGKWQDLPESVRRSHLQERLVEGAMFVNPPLPGNVAGSMAGLPPVGAVVEGQAVPSASPPPTRMLGTTVWGQLTVIGGPKQGVVFPLRSPVVTIGRAPGNDVVLMDETVSSRHARIEQQENQIVIADLNSANGTLINGQRVQQTTLVGGEVVLVGNTPLRFEQL